MYVANSLRYDGRMPYIRCGNSGLKLPRISLGLWHNFGNSASQEEADKILKAAFDAGINHFDLANNYGYPAGSAESNFGQLFRKNFIPYRDEIIVSTKAGFGMWPGPYGDGSSRKYLLASLDQSLKRMGLDYVDIFYSHRYDGETPIEETVQALARAVQSGKALYVGLSNYPVDKAREAIDMLHSEKVPYIIYQGRYNILDRSAENGMFQMLQEKGSGFIAYCVLAQGLISDRYLSGIPADSRAADPHGHLQTSDVKEEVINRMRRLNEIAASRGQSLAQMAFAWVLHNNNVTTALTGVSSLAQLQSNLQALQNTNFSDEELREICND